MKVGKPQRFGKEHHRPQEGGRKKDIIFFYLSDNPRNFSYEENCPDMLCGG